VTTLENRRAHCACSDNMGGLPTYQLYSVAIPEWTASTTLTIAFETTSPHLTYATSQEPTFAGHPTFTAAPLRHKTCGFTAGTLWIAVKHENGAGNACYTLTVSIDDAPVEALRAGVARTWFVGTGEGLEGYRVCSGQVQAASLYAHHARPRPHNEIAACQIAPRQTRHRMGGQSGGKKPWMWTQP